MALDNSSQVLVVILAIFLAIFLLLAIVLIILLIRVVKQIQSVTKIAQNAADGVNNIVGTVSRVAAPAEASRLALKFAKQFFDKHKK